VIRRLLVANRGEIAVRILRGARELGIETVAVHSDEDADAPHVRAADRSVRIGPPPARESYLSIPAIIGAARETGADAIHPGYGFLAEDAGFSQACRDAGIIFVGPPPEAMRALGAKRGARDLAARAGLPIVPGYSGGSDDDARMAKEAERIGFPLLVKASAGGGGKGMRLVTRGDELPAALAAARREAEAAFGDGRLLLERYLESVRHVEIQILADSHGNVIHLGERDCSVQRRHQKIVEESPSPAVDDTLRARMGEAAVAIACAAGYRSAGTVEFMLDPAGHFYFLEVNTRLQVEHPVTEWVTGLDLVHLMLREAAGEPLPLRQEDVMWRGHAIEARVYAEDPEHGFLPSAGEILLLHEPRMPGLRIDSGIRAGGRVSVHYDPILSKAIAFHATRAGALARLRLALRETAILGVYTNLAFLQDVLAHPTFAAGGATTRFVEECFGDWQTHAADAPPPEAFAVAILAESAAQPGHASAATGAVPAEADPHSPWRSGR